MFQQHLAIFHKRCPLPVWFLHPWLSATNGFYRNYQELGGGKMGGAENNFGGAFAPPLAPPGAATAQQALFIISRMFVGYLYYLGGFHFTDNQLRIGEYHLP